MTQAKMPRVAIAACTYQRPDQLRRLLESLCLLEYPRDCLSVVIVDHDPDKTGEPVVDQFRNLLDDLRCEHEPVRLISAARNRLAALALRTGATYVAFVDDDEWVPPSWLRRLVSAAERLNADAIAGPVLPEYEPGVPAWVIEEQFFLRPRFKTGERVRGHGIGNVLVRSGWLDQLSPPFGSRFRVPGGEDVYFLMQLERAGAETRWCDEAVLHEWVPVTRATGRWLVRRSFLMSSAFSECLVSLEASLGERLVRVAKCAGRTVEGAVRVPFALLLRRRGQAVRAGAKAMAGIGGIRGLMLKAPNEVEG